MELTNKNKEIKKNHSENLKGDFRFNDNICYSDQNLKEDLEEYTDGLDEVMKIRPVSYEYNGKAGTDPYEKHVGIIAQEMKDIAPYMIDETGEYLRYNSGALSYMLINATQTQQKYIETLQQQVKELQESVSALQEQIKKRP